MVKKNIEILDLNNDASNHYIWFWNNLLNSYGNYLKNLNHLHEKWNKNFQDSNDVNNLPEHLELLSGISLFNGQWGSGKTFFIDCLINNLNSNDNAFKFFDKNFSSVLRIDLWKYSLTNNIEINLLREIKAIITTSINKKTKKIKREIDEVFDLIEISLNVGELLIPQISLLSRFLKIVKSIKNYKNNIKNLKIKLNKISSIIEKPIVIFMDNFERLGPDSIYILKTINAISGLKNVIFVLVCDKSKLTLQGLSYEQSEHYIDKFINLTEYVFKPSYKKFLEEYFEIHERDSDWWYFYKNITKSIYRIIEDNNFDFEIRDLNNLLNNKNLRFISSQKMISVLSSIYKRVNNVNSFREIFNNFWDLYIERCAHFIEYTNDIIGSLMDINTDISFNKNDSLFLLQKEVNELKTNVQNSSFFKKWNTEKWRHIWIKSDKQTFDEYDFQYNYNNYDFVLFVYNFALKIQNNYSIPKKFLDIYDVNNYVIEKNKLLNGLKRFIDDAKIGFDFINHELDYDKNNFGDCIGIMSSALWSSDDDSNFDACKELAFKNFIKFLEN